MGSSVIRGYKEDYVGWVDDTARAIEEGRFDEIDREALADEVRDLAKSERRELRSALHVILLHMLKSKYQPQKATRSWEGSILIQRDHVAEFLEESPSLRPELANFVNRAYRTARIRASSQTGLEIRVFPEVCEWSVDEILG